MSKDKEKYIKWRIKLICVSIFTISYIMIGGCSKESDNNIEETTKVNENNNGNNDINNNINNNVNISNNGVIDLENYSLEYVNGTDSTPWYFWSYVAESEWGYYMWDWVNIGATNEYRVMFLDKETKQYVPLCSNPNCGHDVEGCNALFLSGASYDMENNFIYYNDGNVYVVGKDKEDYMCLYRIAEDGSSREKYMKLYKANIITTNDENGGMYTEFFYPEVCIHRGYVYFIINKESELKIRRIKLGEENVEEIFSMTGERQDLYRMEAYGDYLFFQGGNFVDENYMDIDGGIMAYNINTGEITMVKKGAISTFCISSGNIYYATSDGISVYSLTDLTDTVLLNSIDPYPSFIVNDNYVFIADKNLKVYDLDGNLVRKITDERIEINNILWGRQLLFAKNGETYLYLDTEDINNAKWIAIK
ncbi:MAG: DUF5050 domain-containing protein [Lachnospiraceae bacterium]|nr:DUF5050 domain-containing protein [Lachnospiraceae bacterium]